MKAEDIDPAYGFTPPERDPEPPVAQTETLFGDDDD